jgi:hypothetical protein
MRFYCYPPKILDYPYILKNINQKTQHKNIIHEIIDIGIHDLIKTKEHRHSKEKLDKWSKLTGELWKVVPDCPDLQKEFQVKTNLDNVEYSKELLLEFFNPGNSYQLPVIQGYYNKPESVWSYCQWFQKEFPGYDKKFGIGTLCRSNDKELAVKACKIVRRFFPNAWIHAFGLRLRHVGAVRHIINSFDSSAWTFPRLSGHSAKTMEERITNFYMYQENLMKYLE